MNQGAFLQIVRASTWAENTLWFRKGNYRANFKTSRNLRISNHWQGAISSMKMKPRDNTDSIKYTRKLFIQSVLLSDDTGGQTYKFQTYRCSWLPNKQQRKCPHPLKQSKLLTPSDSNCNADASGPYREKLDRATANQGARFLKIPDWKKKKTTTTTIFCNFISSWGMGYLYLGKCVTKCERQLFFLIPFFFSHYLFSSVLSMLCFVPTEFTVKTNGGKICARIQKSDICCSHG